MEKEQTYKYLIHLKNGDIFNMNGIPVVVFGDADFGTNTPPDLFGIDINKYELVQ